MDYLHAVCSLAIPAGTQQTLFILFNSL